MSPLVQGGEEVLLHLAEHAPVAADRAGGAGVALACGLAPLRTSRTLTIGSSTMVPMLSRYCWATCGLAMRNLPSGGLLAVWRSAHRRGARSRRSRRNRRRARTAPIRGRDRARRCGLRRRARPDRTASCTAMPRTCWARTSRPPETGSSLSCAPCSTASSAASHSSTSKRLDGTNSALRRLVEPVVGAADALQHAATRPWARRSGPRDRRRPSRCRDRGSRCRPRRAACPATIAASTRAALLDGERAVMHGDRQVVVVGLPQRLEQHLGLAARVDEEQRRLVLLDDLVELGDGVGRRVAGPGDVAPRSRGSRGRAWRRRAGSQQPRLGVRAAARRSSRAADRAAPPWR